MQTNLDNMRGEMDLVKECILSGNNVDISAVSTLMNLEYQEDFHIDGHRCPWHTCQATRH